MFSSFISRYCFRYHGSFISLALFAVGLSGLPPCPSACLPVCLSVCRSTCLSLSLSVCLSVCLAVCCLPAYVPVFLDPCSFILLVSFCISVRTGLQRFKPLDPNAAAPGRTLPDNTSLSSLCVGGVPRQKFLLITIMDKDVSWIFSKILLLFECL